MTGYRSAPRSGYTERAPRQKRRGGEPLTRLYPPLDLQSVLPPRDRTPSYPQPAAPSTLGSIRVTRILPFDPRARRAPARGGDAQYGDGDIVNPADEDAERGAIVNLTDEAARLKNIQEIRERKRAQRKARKAETDARHRAAVAARLADRDRLLIERRHDAPRPFLDAIRPWLLSVASVKRVSRWRSPDGTLDRAYINLHGDRFGDPTSWIDLTNGNLVVTPRFNSALFYESGTTRENLQKWLHKWHAATIP